MRSRKNCTLRSPWHGDQARGVTRKNARTIWFKSPGSARDAADAIGTGTVGGRYRDNQQWHGGPTENITADVTAACTGRDGVISGILKLVARVSGERISCHQLQATTRAPCRRITLMMFRTPLERPTPARRPQPRQRSKPRTREAVAGLTQISHMSGSLDIALSIGQRLSRNINDDRADKSF